MHTIVGLFADFMKNNLHQQRSMCLSLIASLFLVSQLACLSITDVSHLWKASALLGIAYGSMSGLLPTISIEWFGLRECILRPLARRPLTRSTIAAHFSENWGFLSLSPLLGGNIFSLAFGRNLDAHASSELPSTSRPAALLRRAGLPSEARCFEGRDCYIASLHMTIMVCVAALGIALYLGVRDKRKVKEGAKIVQHEVVRAIDD
jgi:hypothetical protein